MDIHDELAALRAELRAVRREMELLPIGESHSGLNALPAILIGQGNELFDGNVAFDDIYGATLPSDVDAPTEVPTAVPSSMLAGATLADGLCVGKLDYDTDAGELVWVATKVRIDGVTYADATSVLVEDMAILSMTTVRLPITGGGGATATVYLPHIIGP